LHTIKKDAHDDLVRVGALSKKISRRFGGWGQGQRWAMPGGLMNTEDLRMNNGGCRSADYKMHCTAVPLRRATARPHPEGDANLRTTDRKAFFYYMSLTACKTVYLVISLA